MTNEDCFAIWAPENAQWTEWAKPVAFAGARLPSAGDSPSDVPCLMIPELPEGWSQTAIVVDLPGDEAVGTGLLLAARGFRPVPCSMAPGVLTPSLTSNRSPAPLAPARPFSPRSRLRWMPVRRSSSILDAVSRWARTSPAATTIAGSSCRRTSRQARFSAAKAFARLSSFSGTDPRPRRDLVSRALPLAKNRHSIEGDRPQHRSRDGRRQASEAIQVPVCLVCRNGDARPQTQQRWRVRIHGAGTDRQERVLRVAPAARARSYNTWDPMMRTKTGPEYAPRIPRRRQVMAICLLAGAIAWRAGGSVPASARGSAPQDKLAKQAYQILKTNCFECHGAPKRVRPRHADARQRSRPAARRAR